MDWLIWIADNYSAVDAAAAAVFAVEVAQVVPFLPCRDNPPELGHRDWTWNPSVVIHPCLKEVVSIRP
jgi:hypothetical protein